MRPPSIRYLAASVLLILSLSAQAQQDATNGEWRYYGGDAGTTEVFHRST